MYLQSLEILGFKSFAVKTVLNFDKGVTAVVGPNGCGKSNVLDAMRWVLGEQSAKALRGGEMADVIFSGTDSRPALGMAEVSLRFADCEKELGVDWNEVCITRRVFRDGGSDYLLNKTPCRLKDIQQLFMDTGIGRSAYSIMEQGKIDQILSSRPEDRRAIFEEAAGITKFKSQKKEALRKLEATEANLVRVTDIIREVKRQIGSLQRQAAKARRYQGMISDLRTLETHHAHRQFTALNTDIEAAGAEIERLTKAQETQEGEIETQETHVMARRAKIEELEESLNEARQAVQDIRSHIQNAEHRIGFNAERTEEFAGLIERYSRDVAGAEEKLAIQQTQIEHNDHELAEIAEALKGGQQHLSEQTAKVNALSGERVETERMLQGVFSGIAKIESRLSALRNEVGSLTGQRDGSEARMGILQSEIEQMGIGTAHLREHLESVRGRLDEQSRELEARNQEAREADLEAKGIAAELEAADRELRSQNNQLAEKESRAGALRQLIESGEGFGEGPKAVLRGLDNVEFFKPAVGGVLASHIQVDTENVAAVEAAFGQNLQAIVMKDSMVAEAVVKTLSAKQWGRAQLILREWQEAAPALENEPAPEGTLGWARERVKVDAALAPVVALLLGRFAIVADLDTAMRMGREQLSAPAEKRCDFVTLAGDAVTRQGLLTGGRAKGENAGASMLHRRNQVAEFEKQAAEIREKIASLTAGREAASGRLDAAKARLGEARDEAQKLTVAVSASRGELQQMEREERETAKKLESLSWEQENVRKRHTEAVEKIGAREQETEALGTQLGDFQMQQQTAAGQLDELRNREGTLTADLNELRIKVATEKQRHDSLFSQRAPMTARLNELREMILNRKRDVEGYRAKIDALEAESARIREEMGAARERLVDAEAEVTRLSEERAAMAGEAEEIEATLRILRRQVSELSERRGQQEVRRTQLQLRIDNLSEHMQRRYQMEIRDFQPDTYLLLTSLRELNKKRKTSVEEPNGETAAALPEPEPPTAVEAAQPAGPGEEIPSHETDQKIDWDRVEELVRELEQRVDSMGPINMDAIQEYDELEQRHTFLEQQLNDLTKSKAELADVIAKINETTRKLFAETFEKIRVNFQEMFVELFGGGKANLVLSDENDPLECGIEVIAKPPGKQLQSITLLSGGEKTMTAVSLLFAIYMVKPSPFCVLDEMDAPLDESNIMRFVKILDRFVSQSQFVVITHNKRTISRADVLYGVTMEEHGVSKLVGVKFAQREDSSSKSDIIGTANPVPVPSIAESFGKTEDLHSERKAG
ncbi:MAG TPA: chromosome segregation protein SMC [Chthoniobacteraceae bacterium]|jgi:chromosome segregation protein|nr:chromosome segregation protein SMC [Chthoniobacteraceae bacterium]